MTTTQSPTVVANAVTCNWNNGNVCAFTNAAATAVTFTNLPTNQFLYVEWNANGCNQCNLTFGSNVSGIAAGGTVTTSPTYGNVNVAVQTNRVVFWSDGTTAWMDPIDQNNPQLWNATISNNLSVRGNIQFPVADGGNTLSALPRGTFFFTGGSQAALAANESYGTFKTVKAITIENIEADILVSPTCSVSEVITCQDCGASAGACTAGQTATISTTTIASGATRQSVDQSITTANVAAGHYISCIVTAGTCTASDNAISMTYRMQ